VRIPEDISVATLGYTIPAGQVYVAKDLVGADLLRRDDLRRAGHLPGVFTGSTRFYEISFNHRLAFVKASDVEVINQTAKQSGSGPPGSPPPFPGVLPSWEEVPTGVPIDSADEAG
jgi:hypothetical protein